MIFYNILRIFVILCFILQIRNFNLYNIKHQRKYNEAMTYLSSDVCIDPITRADLGKFNLCEKATIIVSENPRTAAFYQILEDFHPCGNSRCLGFTDWCISNLHWFVIGFGGFGILIYFKWVDHQRDILFTKLRLPLSLTAEHKD
jgi:hypothetical protein|tara:strand:- start:1449 stop:1883 length:435 start_codon:yes stop_codon:yes gene_type:complete